MEYISQIINSLLNNFDFTFCFIVNLCTYFTIKILNEGHKPIKTTMWVKRLILIVYCILIGLLYKETGTDIKILINSTILAPVFWSWICKPICKKLGVDYVKLPKF